MLGSPMITVKGKNLLAKIVAAKIPLTLSYIGLGDGLQEETEEVISLANEIMKKEIESCKYNEKEGQYYIRRVFTNAELEEGFYIREVGIYAIDPDEGEILYAYTNAGETGVDYFAPGKGKVIVKEIIEMATKFGNAENITVMIDQSIALVTEQEFEDYKNLNKIDIENLQKQIDEHKEEYAELKEDVEQLSNPNLLINGDFQVWQRGESFSNLSYGQYTADRWNIAVPNSDMTNITASKDGGIKISNPNGQNTFLRYFMEESDSISLFGKTLTLSVKLKNDPNIKCITWKFIDNTKDNNKTERFDIIDINIGYAIDKKSLVVQLITINGYHDITYEWAKLEIGDKATPFYPRSYGEELLLCQRYYFRNRWKTLRTAIMNSNALRTCEYNFPVRMRITPTINAIIDQPVKWLGGFNESGIEGPSKTQIKPIQCVMYNDTMCDFQFEHSLEIKDYTIEIKDWAYEFNAEIY